MGILIRKFKKLIQLSIEGKCLSFVCTKLIKILDMMIGIIPRTILKYSTSIDENKVFFKTQENKYTCNPKYITEELLKRNCELTIVWQGDSSSGVPNGIKTVKYNSYEYFKELYSSKIVVINSSLFLGMPVFLKAKQCLIETWHGSLGLKKWGKEDIKDSFKRVFAYEQTGRMTNFCISNSDLENESMRSTFWPKTQILKYGHARNDVFFHSYNKMRAENKKRIFMKYGIRNNTKLVLYAPTFRDYSTSKECFDLDYSMVLSALKKRFGGEWCLLVKYHPSKRKEFEDVLIGINNVVNVTDYPDMQELISIIDVGITDYSSWIYDFILTRKPGFLYASDIEEYTKNDRGFYYPITDTPFSVSKNNKQIVNNILCFNESKYKKNVDLFLMEKGCIDDGNASKRISDLIIRITGNEK